MISLFSPAVAGSGATTPAITHKSYSSSVTPTLATSKTKTVYVEPGGKLSGIKPCARQAGKYTYSVSYRFYVGNDGFYWWWLACSKDTEATDGLGLPGSHSCGDKRVKALSTYLG